MMKWIFFSFLVLLIACQKQEVKDKSMEEILSIIDGTDAYQKRIAKNLDRCAEYYQEDRQTIGDLTAKFTLRLKEDDGIQMTNNEFLEMMTFLLPMEMRNKKETYLGTGTMYYKYRIEGQSHVRAVSTIKTLMNAYLGKSEPQ